MNTKDIYSLAPVNKSAALVTSQSGCEDNIYITKKERLKALCKQKTHYAVMSAQLKDEIGVNRKFNKKNVPLHIYKHPKYQVLLGLMDKLHSLDLKICALKEDIPKGTPKDFAHSFVDRVRERYPDIFDEIRDEIKAAQ